MLSAVLVFSQTSCNRQQVVEPSQVVIPNDLSRTSSQEITLAKYRNAPNLTEITSGHTFHTSWEYSEAFAFTTSQNEVVELYFFDDDEAARNAQGGCVLESVVDPNTYAWKGCKTDGNTCRKEVISGVTWYLICGNTPQ